ncbi:MAG: hypothetical protein WC959_04805 [Kiritimatiellales bacterium]
MANKKTFGQILVVLGFILLAFTGIRTISAPGIFTHIALGQAGNAAADLLSYTMADQSWINMTPLYNSFVYALWNMGGAGMIVIVHVLIVLAAFILMYRFGREWGGPVAQALALLLCARLLLPLFTPGPYVFFMLFTALFITLLYRVRNFIVLAVSILVLQVLWTNLHPSFLFGPVLVLLFGIENWQDSRKTARSASLMTPLTLHLLGLTVAALFATLVNPNLINLHTHIISNGLSLLRNENQEWISLFSGYFSVSSVNNLVRFALVLGAGGLITQKRRLPFLLTIIALFGAFLTVLSPASIHLFAFLAFPFLILSLSAIGEFIVRSFPSVSKAKITLSTAILAGLAGILILISLSALITNRAYAGTSSASAFGLSVQKDVFPDAVSGILERNDFPARIINIAHDGGYLAMENPARKIFCDTRFSFYGEEFMLTLNRALRGIPEDWRYILSEWNPHAVVLNACWPGTGAFVTRRIADRTWKLVYFDGSTVILVRDLDEYRTLIDDPDIQKYGLSILERSRQEYIRKNKGFVKAANPSRLIGAGEIYLALNRPAEAEVIYKTITAGNPKNSGGLIGLGRSLMLQRQISRGIETMECAAKITPRNPHVWMSLYEAYMLKGDKVKVQVAVDRLSKLIKSSKDTATIEQQEATQKQPQKK